MCLQRPVLNESWRSVYGAPLHVRGPKGARIRGQPQFTKQGGERKAGQAPPLTASLSAAPPNTSSSLPQLQPPRHQQHPQHHHHSTAATPAAAAAASKSNRLAPPAAAHAARDSLDLSVPELRLGALSLKITIVISDHIITEWKRACSLDLKRRWDRKQQTPWLRIHCQFHHSTHAVKQHSVPRGLISPSKSILIF